MKKRDLKEQLNRIETLLRSLVGKEEKQDYYSTAEVAEILQRSDWTVREWCRLGRVWAQKRQCGRGVSKEWMISHEELLRIKNEGLLPIQ